MFKGMHMMDIREKECWKQFECSGRIEDYLSFVSSAGQTGCDRTGRKRKTGEGYSGEDEYAGIYMGDGNYSETDSRRRI